MTDDLFTSWSPSFDPEGRWLWFLSHRDFEPIMDRIDQNHIFLDVARPYLVLLQADARSPFLPDAGEGAVDRHLGVPPYPETRAYVRKVLGRAGLKARSGRPRGPDPVRLLRQADGTVLITNLK